VQEIRYCLRDPLLCKRAFVVEARYYCAGEIRYFLRDPLLCKRAVTVQEIS
jgi:hypothetical protein